MMQNFEWIEDPREVFAQMTFEYVQDIKHTIRQILLRFAPEMEAWMKENAQWTDQTGNARQTLYALMEETADEFRVIADYTMWYGVFLELANAGNFAIVAPCIDVFAPRIFQALREALGA